MAATLVHNQAAGLDMEGCGMNIKALAKQADIDIYDFMDITKDELECFAKLVAAHEREECANIAMKYEPIERHRDVTYASDAIRARSKA
jgi:hypothetical protein